MTTEKGNNNKVIAEDKMTENNTIQRRPQKSPALAGVLAIIFPGAGTLYNGQIGKAILYMIAFAGLVTLQTHGGGQPFKALMLAAFYIFQFIESVKTAQAINAGGQSATDVAAPPAPPEIAPSGSIFWGIILIAIGGLFIMANFDMISYEGLFKFWPLAVIVIGFKLIFDSMNKPDKRKKSE